MGAAHHRLMRGMRILLLVLCVRVLVNRRRVRLLGSDCVHVDRMLVSR